jgi:tRNA (guanine37-N1)-methyltransferase
MKISILTLFPEMFKGPFSESIVKRAIDKNLASVQIVNIRDFGKGVHKIVDDTAYGGGVGMLLRVDVVKEAIDSVYDKNLVKREQKVILLSAAGRKFDQRKAKTFSKLKHLILVCGHYEGVDYRIRSFVDSEISIGDFILTGGEIPAMAVTDSVIRLVTGVLKSDATKFESFSEGFLEHPQYTKPPVYEGLKVPSILLSGNHKKISEWRTKQAFSQTKKYRPDLVKGD